MKTYLKNIFFLIAMLSMSFSSLAAEQKKKESHSVVIIGGGVGALTSAIYLARSGVIPIVIEGKSPGGALAQSPKVQNWPGEWEISGFDLVEKIHQQAEQNGVIFLQEEAVKVDFKTKPFTITTQDVYDSSKGHVLEAASCILATGSEPKRLHVKGESEYWSKGVYSCAICDGSLYKDRVVAVVGGGDAALTEAEYLSRIAKHVYVLVRKDSLKANEKQREAMLRSFPNVEFLFQTEVQEIKGSSESVNEIIVKKGTAYFPLSVDAVFLAIGAKPNSELFSKQLTVDEGGYIVVNQDFEASTPGVFALGDIADPIYKQAISAAGDGAKAALQTNHYLLSMKQPLAAKSESQEKEGSYPSKVIEVTSYEQFQHEMQNSNLPILVDFYATWCGPCRQLSPKLEEYAKSLKGKAKILKVNIQSCADLASLYQIRSMPTLVVFDAKGRQVERKVGTKDILDHLKTIK